MLHRPHQRTKLGQPPSIQHRHNPTRELQLLVETDVETGLRWGELIELRKKDIDLDTGVITVSRVAGELAAKFNPDGQRFFVKQYPKGSVALGLPTRGRETDPMISSRSVSSAPARYRFPREVISVAVRWYLRYGLSYRDVEELLAERGIEVDHTTIYRWVQTFTAEFIDAARPARHTSGARWFVDETYVKVAGRLTYLYRAVDRHGQVIDVLVSQRRDAQAARAFFTRALTYGRQPVEVTTDRAPVYPRVLDELVAGARHVLEQYANNRVESDHARLKARLRPMRGLKTIKSVRTIAAGNAFVQNLRRGHYELTAHVPARDRVRVAFGDLARHL